MLRYRAGYWKEKVGGREDKQKGERIKLLVLGISERSWSKFYISITSVYGVIGGTVAKRCGVKQLSCTGRSKRLRL